MYWTNCDLIRISVFWIQFVLLSNDQFAWHQDHQHLKFALHQDHPHLISESFEQGPLSNLLEDFLKVLPSHVTCMIRCHCQLVRSSLLFSLKLHLKVNLSKTQPSVWSDVRNSIMRTILFSLIWSCFKEIKMDFEAALKILFIR